MAEVDELLKKAYKVKVASEDGENTALRIGNLFIDIIKSNERLQKQVKDYDKEIEQWRWLRVQRGEWNRDTANGEDGYRFFEREMTAPDGIHKYSQVVQHEVYKYGLRWSCIADKTTEEPSHQARDWVLAKNEDEYKIKLFSDNGSSFRPNQVDTHIEVQIDKDGLNVTAMLKETAGVTVEWTRMTGNSSEDAAWVPMVDEGDDLYRIHIKVRDMGSQWIYGYRNVAFICTVKIPAGNQYKEVKKKLII